MKENWEKIKLTEGNKSVLSGVPKSLPAMVKSYRIQEKARGVGFDWENADQVWSKVMEEMNEFRAEVDLKSDRMEDVFGDLLFALIYYARFIEINPEDALEKTNGKFIQRFMHIENRAKDLGKSITDMDLEEMETYWQEAKIHLK